MFHPYLNQKSLPELNKVLSGKWIGQGPKVEEFEEKFSQKFSHLRDKKTCVSVNSGTSALHLSYLLADLKKDDLVLAPLLTCTATNIPLLEIGCKIKFVDVDPNTLNMDLDKIELMVEQNSDVKAIVVVHFGGFVIDLVRLKSICQKNSIILIQDAAHALGATYNGLPLSYYGEFTCYSFQAIKHITTGDGGMVVVNGPDSLCEKARRLRWFGIKRELNKNVWDNDIVEIGHKWHMNDIAATLGIFGLEGFDHQKAKRRQLSNFYKSQIEKLNLIELVCLQNNNQSSIEGRADWLFLVSVERREELMSYLLINGIETSVVHFRNDRYSIFNYAKENFDNMDYVENKYLALPLHQNMELTDVERVVNEVNNFYEIPRKK